MKFWLSKILPLMMAGRLPQGTEGNVPDGQGTADGSTPAPDPNADPSASGGVPTTDPGQGAASPTLGQIEDTVYYAIDPNDPSKRILGTQVKESLHRARLVDNMQSRLHTTENNLNAVTEERDRLNSELNELKQNLRIQNQLMASGILPKDAPGVSPTVSNQQQWNTPTAQTPNDEWLLESGTQQPTQPQAQQPVQIPDYLLDPNKLAQVLSQPMKTLVDQGIEQIRSEMTNSLGLTETQRQAQDMTNRTLSQARAAKAQELRSIGIDETEINRILDMEQQSLSKHEEAARLLTVTGPESAASLELAQLAITEGQRLQTDAIKARAAAMVAYEKSKAQIEAQDMLSNDGGFAGVDMSDMPSGDPEQAREYDPKKIEEIRRRNKKKALEIMQAKARAKAAAGII